MDNKKNKKINHQKAFTLIEVMVSVGIFAIVILVSMTAVLSIIDANKKAQALNDVINNMNFSVESMVRDLRTGYNYCSTGCTSNPQNSVTFFSTISNAPVTYSWSANTSNSNFKTIYKTINGSTQSLTSNNINVGRFDLYITDPTAGNGQPIIRMILQATGKVGKQSTEFDLQTLISQRRLNIQ
ncbi:MAG: type II secretion system protein [bacterium]